MGKCKFADSLLEVEDFQKMWPKPVAENNQEAYCEICKKVSVASTNINTFKFHMKGAIHKLAAISSQLHLQRLIGSFCSKATATGGQLWHLRHQKHLQVHILQPDHLQSNDSALLSAEFDLRVVPVGTTNVAS